MPDALKESGATVLSLSGQLTLGFDSMEETVKAVATAGMRDKVKIMIGSGPVDGNGCIAGAPMTGERTRSRP